MPHPFRASLKAALCLLLSLAASPAAPAPSPANSMHCWNGDPTLPNYLSRLHYNTQYLTKILDRIQKTAPPGADLSSWRY